MNKNSLFFYITLFYIFLLCLINWLFYSQIALQKKDTIAQALENTNSVKKFYVDRYVRHKEPRPPRNPQNRPPQKAHIPNFIQMKDMTKEDKNLFFELFSLEILKSDNTEAQNQGKMLFKKPDIGVFEYKKWIYVYDYTPNRKIGIVFRYKNKSLINQTIYTAIFVNLAIFIFIVLVIRKILPLRELKKSIVKFSKGDLNIRNNIKGKDEIAQVSKEFDKAVQKIQDLQNSRNLFLRNIMHELKTPIAKGKMITELMNDEKNSNRLKIILDRFEYLLNEFAKIEQVTSNEFKLNKKEYNNIDILENALDILMIEQEQLDIKVKKIEKLEIDFDLFSIALKNLIDNALKYGKEKPKIILENRKVSIISKGKEIKDLDFEKVFKREFEHSNQGLGLGLYITYNIIKKHEFELKYLCKNGENHFVILT